MSRARKKVGDEKKPPASWIVSFSDMVTLLLAFFVLLQTFASARDPELFFVGQGSFRRAISGFGLSTLFLGQHERPPRDYRKLKYPTRSDKEDTDRRRLIDPDDDRIRETFKNLQREMEVMASDVGERPVSIFSTPIAMGRSDTSPGAEARDYLASFCMDLRRTRQGRPTKVYVIGLAADQLSAKEQWLVSARRAREVERFLRKALADDITDGHWDTYSWGAGRGGEWCETFGLIPEKTYIVLAIMGTKNPAGPS